MSIKNILQIWESLNEGIITYGLCTKSYESLKMPKEYSEAIKGRRKDNTKAKWLTIYKQYTENLIESNIDLNRNRW